MDQLDDALSRALGPRERRRLLTHNMIPADAKLPHVDDETIDTYDYHSTSGEFPFTLCLLCFLYFINNM